MEAHLRGSIVAGVYPLRQDETCHFLAIDFDKRGWEQDISTLNDVCRAFNIPVATERSRSGPGAHACFFFTTPVPANLARRFGSALLTDAMIRRHEIEFKSYDRLFPNIDKDCLVELLGLSSMEANVHASCLCLPNSTHQTSPV